MSSIPVSHWAFSNNGLILSSRLNDRLDVSRSRAKSRLPLGQARHLVDLAAASAVAWGSEIPRVASAISIAAIVAAPSLALMAVGAGHTRARVSYGQRVMVLDKGEVVMLENNLVMNMPLSFRLPCLSRL